MPLEETATAGLDARMRTVRLDEQVDGKESGGWSAGERQLLCLARALLSQAPIVCVDEASSSVDEATSERIRVALDAAVASRGATALVISHRPSTLASCTRFVTVADGLLSEVGREAATAQMTAEEHSII
jgi:ABC-type multidrug transport system fused ATPase/permease subunit